MQTPRTSNGRALSLAVAGLALIAVVVAACGTATGNEPTPSPLPSAPVATPVPSAPATPAPSEDPSPVPSPSAPADGDGYEFPLDTADDHDVVVVISDRNDLLDGARSGQGKDGMSVRWGDAKIRNLDANTIEVTWSAYAKDQTLSLVVIPTSDGVLLRIGQEMPYPNTDAMGADRVVVLDFAEAVSAEQVAAEFTTADD